MAFGQKSRDGCAFKLWFYPLFQPFPVFVFASRIWHPQPQHSGKKNLTKTAQGGERWAQPGINLIQNMSNWGLVIFSIWFQACVQFRIQNSILSSSFEKQIWGGGTYQMAGLKLDVGVLRMNQGGDRCWRSSTLQNRTPLNAGALNSKGHRLTLFQTPCRNLSLIWNACETPGNKWFPLCVLDALLFSLQFILYSPQGFFPGNFKCTFKLVLGFLFAKPPCH